MKTWKKVLLVLVVIGAIAGCSLLYYIKVVCNRPIDMASKTAVSVTADEFSSSFKSNKLHWDSSFINKAVEISGIVKETKTDSATTVVLVGKDSTSTISCLLQKIDSTVKVGDKTSVKGFCRGTEDDMFSGGTIFRINDAIVVKH